MNRLKYPSVSFNNGLKWSTQDVHAQNTNLESDGHTILPISKMSAWIPFKLMVPNSMYSHFVQFLSYNSKYHLNFYETGSIYTSCIFVELYGHYTRCRLAFWSGVLAIKNVQYCKLISTILKFIWCFCWMLVIISQIVMVRFLSINFLCLQFCKSRARSKLEVSGRNIF